MYLAATSSSLLGAHPGIGVMIGPRQNGRRPIAEGRPWAGDNDAFNDWNEERFLRHLERMEPYRATCLFVAAPDVVGDAGATLALYPAWRDRIRAAGYPVAFVCQDGQTLERLPGADAVFVGGSTGFKTGPVAAELMREAKRRGLWVHVGRVNGGRRMRQMAHQGADSVDGTYFSFTGVDRGVEIITGWLAESAHIKEARLW